VSIAGIDIRLPTVVLRPEAVRAGRFVLVNEFSLLNAGAGLWLGHFVHISSHVSILGGGETFLDDFVGICSGSRLVTGTDQIDGTGLAGPLIPASYRSVKRSFVRCEKHAFVGTGSVVLPGVTIGEGAVVGAGSVVTHDLAPWGIYWGRPARWRKPREKHAILDMAQKLYVEKELTPSVFPAPQTRSLS